ncbi:hypothetical protein [Paenibacillus sp. NRS-1780]|uniref:hypothetical protein n=1 Tax=Paenibacillus sp. NRS-1780 TaxID=3233904 RepID=UPI003D2C1CB7
MGEKPIWKRPMIRPDDKFEMLTVKGRRDDGLWDCICDCGNPTYASTTQLKQKTKKSCGCLRRKSPANVIDITGNRYGILTVIARAGRTGQDNAVWLCRCDCGEEIPFRGTTLRRGEAVSCGCQKGEQVRKARDILQTDKSVNGVQIPLLTKGVRSDSKSGHKGVQKRVKKGREYYEAYITVKGKTKYASSKTLEGAIEKRKKLEEKYHQPYIDLFQVRQGKEE